MNIKLILFFILFSTSVYGQGFWQPTSGPGAASIIAFEKGAKGTILAATETKVFHSSNHGASWASSSNTFTLLNANVLATDTAGNIFLADAQNIYKSTNNGSLWSIITGSISGTTFYGITISSHDNLYVGTYDKGVYRSTDHGTTWTQVKNGFPTDPSFGNILAVNAMASSPNGTIFALAAGALVRSTNEGDNWEVIGTGVLSPSTYSLAATASGKLFIATSTGLFQSADNGDSWSSLVNKNGLNTNLSRVVTTDGGQIVLMSAYNGLWISLDDGSSWNIARPAHLNDEDQAVFMDSSAAYIFDGTKNNGVFISKDKGSSWRPGSVGIIKGAAAPLASDNLGNIFARSDAGGYASADLGDTWVPCDSLAGKDVRAMFATSDNRLYAATYGSGLFLSTDHGISWETVLNIPGLYADKLLALTASTKGNIFAGGDNGAIYRFDNTKWLIKVSGLTLSPIQILIGDKSDHLYAVNADGVFRSSNEGDKWTQLTTAPAAIKGLAVDSNGTLYAGNASAVYHSEDLGETWVQGSGSGNATGGVAVNHEGTVYAVGNAGVFGSKDKGVTWLHIDDALNPLASSNLMLDLNGRLYAGTASNGVYRSSQSTILSGVSFISHQNKSIADFKDNFPNPFSLKTNIHFILSKPSFISVDIFDMNGKKITTLFDGFENDRDCSVLFDPGSMNLASGIYSCRLTCEGVSITKKVIYLKQ